MANIPIFHYLCGNNNQINSMAHSNIKDLQTNISSDITDDLILVIDDMEQFLHDKSNSDLHIVNSMMLFCHKGTLSMTFNGHDIEMHSSTMLFALPKSIISNIKASKDFKGSMLLLPPERIKQFLLMGKQVWYNLKFLYETPVIKLTDEEVAVLKNFKAVSAYVQSLHHKTIYQEELNSSMFQSFILLINNFIFTREPQEDRSMEGLDSSSFLFHRFMELINKNNGRLHTVAYFADQLNVTPKYLSQVVKQICGITPLKFIHYSTIREIKHQLRYTDHSIKEISATMGFPNISFFGKFFKNNVGVSPLQYRKQIEKSGQA